MRPYSSAPSWVRRVATLAFVIAVSVSSPSPAAGPHSFYLAQLANGVEAFDRAEWVTAARTLRIACFGLLEEPQLLAPCLVRLAVAQDESGDVESFRESFRRLVEVETRFSSYTQGEIPATIRTVFEQHAAARIPEETLAAQPAFRGLLTQKAALRLEALPPKARREEIAKRLAAEPREPVWHVLLGRLEIAENEPTRALAAAQAALTIEPKNPRALCVRGLAFARTSQCALAIPDLSGCAETPRFATPAAAYLRCLIDQRRASDAESFVASLAAGIRDDREIQRLTRQITNLRDGADSKKAPLAPTVATPRAAAPSTTLDAKQRQTISDARALLTPSASARELKRALNLVRELADDFPADTEAQLVAAEAAYRNSRWQEAADYFRKAGDPGEGRPELLFYWAVSAFESGDRATAASALKRALPNLQASPFIDEYTQKILGETR